MNILRPISLKLNLKSKEDIKLLLELDSVLNKKYIALKDTLPYMPKKGHFVIEPYIYRYENDYTKVIYFKIFYKNSRIKRKSRKISKEDIQNFLAMNTLIGIDFQEYIEGNFKCI